MSSAPMRNGWRWLMLAAVVLTPAPAFAQADASTTARLERQLRQAERAYVLQINPALSLTERAVIDYGALVSFGFLAVDDTDQRTRILRQTDAQLFGYLNVDGGVHEAFGRLRFTYQDFNTGDSFDGGGDKLVHPLSDRWWYRFNMRRAIEAYSGEYSENNLIVQVGRQYVDWGSGLALSEQLYAARATLEFGNAVELQGLFGRTPSSSVVDFDSSRPSWDGDTERTFIAGMVTLTFLDDHRPYFYYLDQTDNNDEDSATLVLDVAGTPVPFPTRFHYDSTYYALGSTGRLTPKLDYQVEAIMQTGHGFSNSFDPVTFQPPPFGPEQRKDPILAFAGRALLTYHLRDANLTRFEWETIVATGDDDRELDTSNTFGGNAPGTRDRAFNGFGFANTGLAFAAPVSNLIMGRLGASTYPLRNGHNAFRRLQVGTDLFLFSKYDNDAPLNEATENAHLLGFEADAYVNWRLASDVVLFLRYGAFFPGEAISADSDVRHFLFTGLTYSF